MMVPLHVTPTAAMRPTKEAPVSEFNCSAPVPVPVPASAPLKLSALELIVLGYPVIYRTAH